jgi:hypothetical protein
LVNLSAIFVSADAGDARDAVTRPVVDVDHALTDHRAAAHRGEKTAAAVLGGFRSEADNVTIYLIWPGHIGRAPSTYCNAAIIAWLNKHSKLVQRSRLLQCYGAQSKISIFHSAPAYIEKNRISGLYVKTRHPD